MSQEPPQLAAYILSRTRGVSRCRKDLDLPDAPLNLGDDDQWPEEEEASGPQPFEIPAEGSE